MANPELIHEAITGLIRQTAFEVHNYFGCGFLEKIYENSLVNRLRKKGIRVEQQRHIAIFDEDGTVVGEYFADLLVNEQIVVEVKAVTAIAPENKAQRINYLKGARLGTGVLINFGGLKLEFKRFVIDSFSACSACSVVN